MNNELEQNNNLQPELEEESIDYRALISKAWMGRKLIFKITLVFFILGFIAAITLKRSYTVTVTLAPEITSGRSSGGLSSIASMFGMGMNMSNGTDAFNVTNYPDIVASTPFLVSLFDVPVVDTKKEIDTTFVGYLTQEKFSLNPLVWIGKGLAAILPANEDELENGNTVNIFNLTKKQETVVEGLKKCIVADVDKKTGITTLNVTLDNPIIAAIVADSAVTHLKDYIINYRTSKAREDLAYYEKIAEESHQSYLAASQAVADYNDHNRGLISNAVIAEGTRLQNELSIASQVYSQMKQQAEMAKAKVQEEKPAFATIQPASVPHRANNSRLKTWIMWIFAGFVISVAWVLYGKQYYAEGKKLLMSVKEEEALAEE